MYRRLCLVLLIVLTVGLVLTRRRLSDAQAELRLLRVAARARDTSRTELTSESVAVTTSHAQAAVSAESPAQDFSEWEQAIPPMDS